MLTCPHPPSDDVTVNLISSVLTSFVGIYLWNASSHIQVAVVLGLTFFTVAVAIAAARNEEQQQKTGMQDDGLSG